MNRSKKILASGELDLAVCALCILVCLLIPGCGREEAYPPHVAEALATAGNAAELEQVIRHYSAAEDSLELRAAFFLIGNMDEHCFAPYRLIDADSNDVDFDVLDYPDYDSLRAAVKHLEEARGELEFIRGDKIWDLQTVTAEFLIGQIDYAFAAWRRKPWARQLSFEAFLEFVLPYRGSNEPLESWREYFWKKYAGLVVNMSDSTDALAAASLINDDIRSWFRFDPRFYYHPADQGLSEMLETGLGRCEDMTNLAIYAMRANGIAVTSDYTPYWANAAGNHAWNAIVSPAGKVIPFMGAEANPGEYKLSGKLAKVYRKTFSQQPDNLIFQERKQEAVPRWLTGKSYIDVTADYVTVCDVAVDLDQPPPDSVDIAYLCVFNSGAWEPIDWGRIMGREITFTNVGPEITYLPAFYLNGQISPCAPPFILTADCWAKKLTPDEQDRIELQLTSTAGRREAVTTDGVARTSLMPDKEYELFFWRDGWQSAGTRIAGDTPVRFAAVPANGLYWLVGDGSDKDERIFTYENGRQVWW